MLKLAARAGKKLTALAITALAALAWTASAQAGPWKVYGPQDGLNAALILDIHLDREGFIWLCSQYSLARFDGKDWKYWLHDSTNPSTLAAGQVYSVREDSSGRYLVSTDSALCRLDPRTDRFERFLPTGDERKPERVFTAIEDSRGRIWVNSERALYRLETRAWGEGQFKEILVHKRPSEAFQQSFPILETKDGSVWAGSGEGLFRLPPGSEAFREVNLGASAQKGMTAIYSIVEAPSGMLFLGTENRGLLRLDPRGEEVTELGYPELKAAAGARNRIRSLNLGLSGTIWLAGEGGVCRFEPASGRLAFIPADPSVEGGLPDRDITSVAEDGAGNLWLGHTLGVAWTRIAPNPFRTFLSGKCITDFLEEGGDSYLLGVSPSVYRWNKASGRLTDLATTKEFSWLKEVTEGVSELVDDGEGGLWMGCGGYTGSGIFKTTHSGGAVRHFTEGGNPADRIPSNLVFELRMAEGSLWAGTGRGLSRFDRAAGRFVAPRMAGPEAARLGELEIWRIEADGKGKIWIGTNKGLFLYDPASGEARVWIHDPEDKASLSDNWILDLILNGDGSLWVGTAYGGLDLFDPVRGRLDNFGPARSFPSSMMLAMARGEGEDLWLGTGFGLVHLLDRAGNLKVYHVKDGIPSNDFVGTSACLRASDGTLLFGTSNGAFWFDQKALEAESRPSPARLLSLASQDGKIEIKNAYSLESLRLPWQSNSFSVDFAALDYSPGAETEFAYRLSGLDRDWIENGTNRTAHYAKLPGGSYVFEVKATDSSGRWSPESAWARLPIEVGTHPLKTGWAYAGYVLLGLAALAAAFFLNRRRQGARLAAARAETERERAVSERLTRLDQLKDAFLANTSHELRTPLHGIVGIAESLAEGAAGELAPAVKDNLAMITSSGRRLASLVDDILDFSRLKEKDIVLNLKAVDLGSMAELVIMLTKPLVKGREIELVDSIPPGLPPVLADAARLQQILHNLIGNAVKFTAAGSVEIGASATAEAPADGKTGSVSFFVRDTGIGIPAERLESIFLSFEQVDASISREYGGTGLGLTITKHLVELMGGAIGVESEPGRGSTFTVTLPVAEEAAGEAATQALRWPGEEGGGEAASVARLSRASYEGMEAGTAGADPPEAAPASGGGTPVPGRSEALVLVVDDEPINLQVLANILSLRSYQVVQATSGEEALRLAGERRPDLVLLDVMMPRMNGYEVCGRLRSLWPASELPVIMLTARNQVADLVQGLESGANDYLAKPFSGDELVARIRTHLDLARINISLERFVPREFLDILDKRSIVDLRLGDQVQREMSVMFCDVRDFTSLSEGMSAAETFAFVNEYLSRVVPAIRAEGGIIDKYIGDAVMVLFPKAPDAAIRAALGVERAVRALSSERLARGQKPIAVGAGIHTGTLILGTVGEEARMQETVISDAVNLASRVEGLTKTFGSSILASKECLDRLERPEAFSSRFLGMVAVKGRAGATRVYEILDAEQGASRIASGEEFGKALESYYGCRFDEAVTRFSAISHRDPGDKAAARYLQRSAAFIAAPPPPGWDGVERPESK